jgi:hypothetical protein
MSGTPARGKTPAEDWERVGFHSMRPFHMMYVAMMMHHIGPNFCSVTLQILLGLAVFARPPCIFLLGRLANEILLDLPVFGFCVKSARAVAERAKATESERKRIGPGTQENF